MSLSVDLSPPKPLSTTELLELARNPEKLQQIKDDIEARRAQLTELIETVGKVDAINASLESAQARDQEATAARAEARRALEDAKAEAAHILATARADAAAHLDTVTEQVKQLNDDARRRTDAARAADLDIKTRRGKLEQDEAAHADRVKLHERERAALEEAAVTHQRNVEALSNAIKSALQGART